MTKEEILEKSRAENKNMMDPAMQNVLINSASIANGIMMLIICVLVMVESFTGNKQAALPLFLAFLSAGTAMYGFIAFKTKKRMLKVLFVVELVCWLVFAAVYVLTVLKRCNII